MAPRNNVASKLNMKDSKVNTSSKKQATVKPKTKKPSVNSKRKVSPKRNRNLEKIEVSTVYQEISAGASSSNTQRVARGKRTLEPTKKSLPEIQNVAASARRSRIPRRVMGVQVETSAVIPESSSSGRNLRSSSRNKRLEQVSGGTSQNIKENPMSASSGRQKTNSRSKRTLVASGQTSSVIPKTPSRIGSKKRVDILKTKRTPKITAIASTSEGSTSSKGRPLKRQRTVEERSCVICLDTVRNSRFKSTPCQHWFHNKCLNEWLAKSTTCPTCRFVLKDPSLPAQPESSRTLETIFGGFVQVQLSNNFSIDLASGIVTITI